MQQGALLLYAEPCELVRRYTALLDRLDTVPMAELVMAIRRTSPGFTRGSSSFRGVTQHKSGEPIPALTALPWLICLIL